MPPPPQGYTGTQRTWLPSSEFVEFTIQNEWTSPELSLTLSIGKSKLAPIIMLNDHPLSLNEERNENGLWTASTTIENLSKGDRQLPALYFVAISTDWRRVVYHQLLLPTHC